MSFLRSSAAFILFLSTAFPQITLEAPIRFFEFMPNTPGTLYALPVKGLLRSTDSGVSWTQVPIRSRKSQPPALFWLAFSPQTAATIYVCGDSIEGAIAWKTVDGGLNWSSISQGLPTMEGRRCEQLEPIGANLYAQVSGGPDDSWELFKSTNGGESWTRLGSAPRQIAISPSSPAQMYYPSGYNVYRSQNEGQTFSIAGQVRTPGGDLNGVNSVAVNPTNPSQLLATMTGPNSLLNGIFQSTNGGASWVRVQEGNNVSVRYSRNNPMEAWAGDCCGNLSVYRSINGGASWSNVRVREGTRSLPFTRGPMLRSLPGNTQTILGGTARGLYRSEDGGTGWQRLGTYSPWVAVRELVGTLQLLTRESVVLKPRVTIQSAEDPNHSLPEISVSGDDVPWIASESVSGSTYLADVSARMMTPGQYERTLRITVPGAGNSPLKVKLRLNVTDQIRNSFAYVGPLGGFAGPDSLALSPSGGIVYPSLDDIYERTPAGQTRRIAGGGTGGDGGPADQAEIGILGDVAYSPQGELFLVERINGRIRKIDRNGIISTYAGGGAGTAAAGMSPTAVRLSFLRNIAFDPAGNLVFADSNRLWRVRNDRLEILAGGGVEVASGTQATAFAFSSPQDLLIAPDGRIFFTVVGLHAIFVLENGRVFQFAGSASWAGQAGDGGPATEAQLRQPTALALSPTGVLYFSDNSGTRIRRVGLDGRVEAVMGAPVPGDPGLCAVAESAPLRRVDALLVWDRTLLFSDGLRIQQIALLQGASSGQPPAVPSDGVVHAGSFEQKIGPGVLFSIFGERLAAGEMAAPGAPWPNYLGSTAACLDGYPVPLFYTNTGQLNGQAHYSIRTGQTGYLRVFTAAGVSPPVPVNLTPTSPGVFQYGDARAIAVNPDGRVNGPNAPASPGQVVVVYLSGTGALDRAVPTGEVAPATPLSRPRTAVAATINGQPALMYYLGLTPGFIGLAQANVEIPNLPSGDYDLVFTIGGVSSKPVKISIR